MYSAGDCILIITRINRDGSSEAHLFVVIFDTNKTTDKTILIPLCSIHPRRYYDKTVVINPGDHDFVKAPTFLDYSSAIVKTSAKLDEMIIKGEARRRQPPLNKALTQRVREGTMKTDDIPYFIISVYEDLYP